MLQRVSKANGLVKVNLLAGGLPKLEHSSLEETLDMVATKAISRQISKGEGLFCLALKF
jgi:hypothetical protein